MKVSKISPINGELVSFDGIQYLYMNNYWFLLTNNRPVLISGDYSKLDNAYEEFKNSKIKKPFSYE